MGCRFCASTIGGLERNLSPSEMLGQIYQIQKITGERVSNVVVMGTGEPMDNYENFLTFVRMLTDEHGLHISQRNLTVSTCGIVPKIRELAMEHLQITLALSLRKNINEYWGIETGVQYTYLRSDFTIINDSYLEKTQKISYIGIPLKGSFKIWQQQKFSIYTSAGLTLDIPVKATLEELTSENRLIISQKKSRLYPHLQWSADFGIGIQYHITPSIGIYTEPNLRYYFNDGSRLNTIRATKPFNMTLPIGIRLSW